MLICFSVLLQEVAEPLQDLKEGMDQLEKNKTLRHILTTLLAIGNFLNSTDVSDCGPNNDPAPPGVFYWLPLPLLLPLPCQHIYVARMTVGSVCVRECARLTACLQLPSTVKVFVVASV